MQGNTPLIHPNLRLTGQICSEPERHSCDSEANPASSASFLKMRTLKPFVSDRRHLLRSAMLAMEADL